MNFTRSYLLAMVAVGALTLSACGKKKEEAKDLGAPAPAAPAPTQPADPAQQPPVQQGSVTMEPATPPAAGGEIPKDPRADRGSAGRPGTSLPGSSQAGESELGRPTTGGKNSEGLVYTGSSPDETLDLLKRNENSLSTEQQQKNKKLAQSIETVEFNQDTQTQVATISVRLKGSKHSEIYNLSSKPLVDNGVVNAVCVNSALGFRTSGSDEVSGSAQCLDLNLNGGRCNNVLFTVVLKKGASKAATQILIRSTYADVTADLKESSGGHEFAVLKDFLLNSYLHRETRNKVESINMVSYEILNGRSVVDLQILGLNKEYMGFRGELLSSQNSSKVNVAFQKTSPRTNSGLPDNDDVRLNMLESLGPVRLVMNNGLGKLALKASVRSRGNSSSDEVLLTFTRRVSAVVPVNAGSLQ